MNDYELNDTASQQFPQPPKEDININYLPALDALNHLFGAETFRPGQFEIIEKIMAGKNVLGVLPTGTGKSACFQIPATMMDGLTVVIVPFRSLMVDQVYHAKRRGIPAEYINGDLKEERKNEIRDNLHQLKLLYVCPESLYSGATLDAIQGAKKAMVVIDEAHSFQQSDDFRVAYNAIKKLKDGFDGPFVTFTATCTERTLGYLERCLDIPFERVIADPYRANLDLKLFLGNQDKMLGALAKHKKNPGLIFVRTRKIAEDLRDMLAAIHRGIKVLCYHAGFDDLTRLKTQKAFTENDGPVWVVATKAFGTGIDKADIRFIYHLGPVETMVEYFQQIGRGGRDGDPCECHTFFEPGARDVQEFFIDNNNPQPPYIKAFFNYLITTHKIGVKFQKTVTKMATEFYFFLIKKLEWWQNLTEDDQANVVARSSSIKSNIDRENQRLSIVINILRNYHVITRFETKEEEYKAHLIQEPPQRAKKSLQIWQVIKELKDSRRKITIAEIFCRLPLDGEFDEDSIKGFFARAKKSHYIDYEPPYRGSETLILQNNLDGVDWPYLAAKREADIREYADVKGFIMGLNEPGQPEKIRNYFAKATI